MHRQLLLTVAVIVAAGFVKVTKSDTCDVTDYSLEVGITNDDGTKVYIAGTETQVTCWVNLDYCKGGCTTTFQFDIHIENSEKNETAECSSARRCCMKSGNTNSRTATLEDCTDGVSRTKTVEEPTACSCATCVTNEALPAQLDENTCHKYYYDV